MRALHHRHSLPALVAVAIVIFGSTNGFAQLDPLLFLKRVHPTIILVADTSIRMLSEENFDYYDPHTYAVADDSAVAGVMGVPEGATTYRRIYKNLRYTNIQDPNTKWEADDVEPVANTQAGYATFWDSTRLQIMKKGIALAVDANEGGSYRWGLIKLRQDDPQWRTGNNCDKPVSNILNDSDLDAASDSNPCSAGNSKLGIYVPTVSQPNYDLETTGDAVLVGAAPGTASSILAIVNRDLLDNSGTGLIPAGGGTRSYQDRPLTHALDDARAQAVSVMNGDSLRDCRNTIVVLLTGGKDEGDSDYTTTHNAATTASTFAAVTAGGVTRRVPIYVAAIKPAAADEASLQTIASNSGGRYFKVTDANGVARVISLALQAGFRRSGEHDTSSTSEYQSVSPIVGTVNLEGAKSSPGTTLSNTSIARRPNCVDTTDEIPQRSNVLLTSGFALPDFEGRLRAFRAYRPVEDCAKPSGWKFVSDGTPLWPVLAGDSRTALAGMARVPESPDSRKIYTVVPQNGSLTTVAFTTANAALISPYLGGADASVLIPHVRSLGLGAVISSTPAIMDAPSLDPPPDDEYGREGAAGSFADTYKNRRSVIFVGGNNGMVHAVDARTGYELWAFIPFNLLPKLRALLDGQSVNRMEYFVDSSPKIAEVKINYNGTHQWRSLLIIGQGNGGTFYQAFDVTEAGMGVSPTADSLSDVDNLRNQFTETKIRFLWSFPQYTHFDTTTTTTLTINDGTFDEMTFFGDLNGSSTSAERTVGFTWSDPAVGPLNDDRTVNAVVVGSGYFPKVEASLPFRSTSLTAGAALYLINAETGLPIGNAGGACSGTGCLHVGDAGGSTPKNALQADPSAATDYGQHVVKRAYMGDLDGSYWKFSFTESGAITSDEMVDTGKSIYGSSALLLVGTVNQYMFFTTGSDLLPPSAPNATGTFRLFGIKDNGTSGTTVFSRTLSAVSSSNGLATGERPSSAPSVAGDIVFFTTTTENGAAPCAEFSANLYGVTYLGGTAYDTDSTAGIQKNESPIISTVSGRATAPFIVDQHLYFGGTGNTASIGSLLQAFGDPEDFNNGVGQVGVRILSWREIR